MSEKKKTKFLTEVEQKSPGDVVQLSVDRQGEAIDLMVRLDAGQP